MLLEIFVGDQPQQIELPPGTEITEELVDEIAATMQAQQQAGGAGLLQSPGAALGGALGPQPDIERGSSNNLRDSPLIRAGMERVVDPTVDLLGPGSTLGQRALGAAQLGGIALAPGVALAGAGVQVGAELAGAPSGAATLLGILTEFAAFPASAAARGVRASGKAAGTLREAGKVAEATAESVGGGLNRTEALAQAVRKPLGVALRQRKAALQPAFDAAEKISKTRRLKLKANTPEYLALQDSVAGLVEAGVQLPGQVGAELAELSNSLTAGVPIATSALRTFGKKLSAISGSRDIADPRAGRFANALKTKVDDAFEAALPSGVKSRFVKARAAFRTDVKEPEDLLKAVLNPATSPQKVFNALFSTNDPITLRLASSLAKDSPGVLGKLRVGFLERVSQASNEFENAKKAADLVGRFRPTLTKAGLFSAKELDQMQLLFRKRRIPTITQVLKGAFQSTTSRLATGGLAAGGAGTLLSSDPRSGDRLINTNPGAMLAIGLAAGMAPQLLRLGITGQGAKVAQQLGGAVISRSAQFARTIDNDARDIEQFVADDLSEAP